MDVLLLWKLLNNGRLYGERRCRQLRCDSNVTNIKICLYLLANFRSSQYDIAAAYHMAECTVAKALRRLEEEGLVQREINPADRRARIVSLTEKGRKAYEQIREIQADWASAMSGCLTDDENREFNRLCGKALRGSERLLNPDHEI